MPLRSPRAVTALAAAGVAASLVALTSVPAVAANVRTSEWWLSALKVQPAWTVSKGSGVTVAVLSDGVDASQADLTGSVTAGPDEVGGAPDSGQYFGQVGTGLASLIAGHGHGAGDTRGIIGIAPQARILSVPVTLPAGDPLLAETSVAAALPAAIAAGIRYAAGHGATVIDLPIDPGQPDASGASGQTPAAGGSAAERAAVQSALARGVVLVAPAGDDGAGSDAANFPAAYPGVIAVGAFDQNLSKARWTSHQGYVTVTAAGVNVAAAANDGGYQTLSSTSAAAAMVAGIVALIRSKYPRLSVAQIRRALTTSTVFHGSGAGSGAGTVSAQGALTAAAADLPAGSPAGSGAQPWLTGAAPAVSQPSLMNTVLRDGIMSAALLIVLLLLVGLYGAVTRRRMVRQQEAIAAEWTGRQAQSRYPQPGVQDSDAMLEYFAAPTSGARPSRPDRAKAAEQPAPGIPAGADREPVTSLPGGRPITSRLGGAPPASASPWDDVDVISQPAPGLAAREVDRRPRVTGAPPWEPAAQPASDLPWTSSADLGQHDAFAADGVRIPAGPGVGRGRVRGASHARGPSHARGAAQPGGPAGPGGPGDAGGPANSRRPGGAAAAARAGARAGAAAAAQAAQAAHAAAQPGTAHSYPGSAASPSGPGSLWQRSVPESAQPALASGQTPADGTGIAGQSIAGADGGPSLTGRLDWRKDLAGPGPAAPGSGPGGLPDPAAGLPAASGGLPGLPAAEYAPQRPDGPLPVRQPRQAAPDGPLSPSGSLWERPADQEPAASQDPGSRPIYVWNPGAATESFPAAPAEPAGELKPEPRIRRDWRRPPWDGAG